RKDDGENERLELVGEQPFHRDRGGIGRAAEEHRRAERYQASVSDQQIHSGAIQRVDGDLGDQAHWCAERGPEERERHQHRGNPQHRMAQDRARSGAIFGDGRGHSKRSHRSPSNPRGRSNSTTAMKTYITALAATGSNWMVMVVTMPTSSPAITAPANDPNPPIVTTTKAGMIAPSCMAG